MTSADIASPFRCICVPMVSAGGHLVYAPAADCPVPEHRKLARELLAPAHGIRIADRPA